MNTRRIVFLVLVLGALLIGAPAAQAEEQPWAGMIEELSYEQLLELNDDLLRELAEKAPPAISRVEAAAMCSEGTAPSEWDCESLMEEVEDSFLVPEGITLSSGAVDISDEVDLRGPASDLEQYACFPQDYSEGDEFNRGCAELQQAGQLPWDEPLAGYHFGFNDACRDRSRRCNIQVVTWNWLAITGEEIALPGIGSLRDPDGGAAMAIIMNAWEIPGELEDAYILHGFWGTGEVWNMEDLTTDWDEESETYVDNEYGDYSLETLATLRDHFLYQLTETELFRGQCSDADNCETVSWVAAIRWYDGSYHIVDSGQYVR